MSETCLTAIAAAVNGGADPRPYVDGALARAKADKLNAVVRTTDAHAERGIERIDARIKAGEHLPLAGVPRCTA